MEDDVHSSSNAMIREESRILVVEDDSAIARLIEIHLKAAGYQVVCCANGIEAMHQLQEHVWSLVILDRLLPGKGGMQILRWIRSENDLKHLPVMVVTALGQTSERVYGLKQGADDYLPKPFEPDEMVARVDALLRRTGMEKAGLRCAHIQLDPEVPEVRVRGKSLELRRLEFLLLYELMKRAGKVCRREYLLDHVWGRDVFVEPRTVDVTVKRLRRSLAAHGVSDCIETVRGIGYRFVDPDGGDK
jgi:DNA-binding response OmpR family regulator